ncbi:MAG: hypothetical protein F4X77_20640 [Acidobacteriia bacterium]|nr:hypothetical protein [Terriglobia bacterium]MYC65571.1 hypothetical protein [Terriglobia bacterium]
MCAVGGRGRFIVGDLLATSAACALIAAIAGLVVPAGWAAWAAMAAGMLAGMVLAVPCWLVAGLWLGMIEPMLQIMLGGMLAGMAGGMAAVNEVRSDIFGLMLLGLACGAATSLATACADWALRRWGSECP